MNRIKAIAASFLFAFAAVCPAWAVTEPAESSSSMEAALPGVVETVMYTSKSTGIIVEVPANAKLFADNMKDGVLFRSDDQMYVFAAVPFDTKTMSGDEIAENYKKFTQSAKIDLSKSITFKGKTETVQFDGDIMNHPNGTSTLVSVVFSNTTTRGFFVSIVAGAQYVQSIHSTFRTIGINSSAVQ